MADDHVTSGSSAGGMGLNPVNLPKDSDAMHDGYDEGEFGHPDVQKMKRLTDEQVNERDRAQRDHRATIQA